MLHAQPENFLLAAAGDLSLVRLTDFGLSTFYVEGQAQTELLGSPYYIAPEVIRQSYGLEADVWSAGAVGGRALIAFIPALDGGGGGLGLG